MATERLDESLGTPWPRCAALVRALEGDFSADGDNYGHAQLNDVQPLLLRALASDELLQAGRTVVTNLIEMRLHELAAQEMMNDGTPPRRTKDRVEALEGARHRSQLGLEIAGFFRATGSVLDCLTAVAIILLRIPLPARRASAAWFGQLSKRTAKVGSGFPATQQAAWGDFEALVQRHRAREPRGWYDWMLQTRHAVVHRGRKFNVHTQELDRVGHAEPLEVVTDDPIGVMLSRGQMVPHLPAQPEAADTLDLIGGLSPTDVILPEPAALTLVGVRTHLIDLVEDATESLLKTWQRLRPSTLGWIAPTAQWKLPETPASKGVAFAGFGGGHVASPGDVAVTGPLDALRAQVANKVKENEPASVRLASQRLKKRR